jgi:hypothetical protein
VDTIVTCVRLDQMILKFGGNWLMRGENTSVINTILQKMLPVKGVRVKVTRLLINSVKLDRVLERKVLRVVLNAMNFHARK